MPSDSFRVLLAHLDTGRAEPITFGSKLEHMGGSGLAAALYQAYGLPGESWDHPDQPLIFAIGPLQGYFPLMSKVVCGFVSPYHNQYAESHAGGRLGLALRFAGLDALVILGRAPSPSSMVVGPDHFEVRDTHYLWGMDCLRAGKLLRRIFPGSSGHRSILRIGQAGENKLAYGCINVDTYRHFGRLGAGSVMGAKLLKAVVVQGAATFPLPEGEQGKDYAKLFKQIYKDLTATDMMSKYHDLGTPQNLVPLNELSSLPWRNLQATRDDGVQEISGERFAERLLLRNTACSGCPVGCIHVGMLRRQFAEEHQFLYRKVGYDYELIFALGSMVGVKDASDVLELIEDVEKLGLDAMSAGVAMAWATEALERGVVSLEQVLEPLAFGQAGPYRRALVHLAVGANDFYKALGRGAMEAARIYGGEDFACVLGQEMAGYATGEVFFTAQGLGFRHSHLDSGGYSYDQKTQAQDVEGAVKFLVSDERDRCLLTSMVSCLFARGVYKPDVLAECLSSIGYTELAGQLPAAAERVQRLRWQVRLASGYKPEEVRIPKRFREVVTWKGPVDSAYLDALRTRYQEAIREMGEMGEMGEQAPEPQPEQKPEQAPERKSEQGS